jgi:hypothetical protein
MAVLTPVELDFLQGRRELKVAAAIHYRCRLKKKLKEFINSELTL